MVACAEHGRLCAYRGDEADRCPWCHSLWAYLVANPDRHSCESRWVMRDHPGRADRAARNRHEAATNLRRAPNTAGVGTATGGDSRGRQAPSPW